MASLLAAGSLTGCGTVPDSRIVPEGFAPPGTPVDVQLQWDGGGPTVFYDHTQSGAVAATAGAGIVGLLLLPLALIDVLPAPVKDDATRARLLAIIDDETDIEDLARGDRARVEQARTQARERARSDNLYPEEATMLAIDAWVADSGELLKQAFTGATRALAQAMQAMRDHPGPPTHNRMSVSRVIFPMFYDDQLPVGDLDEFRVDPDGRRLLRSRIEPMRGAGSTDDQAANVWFSVPAVTDGDEVPEKALIEFLYRWPVAPGKDGS